jgi:hypothetical protein
MPAAVIEKDIQAVETKPTLDGCDGTYHDCYAVLSTPEMVVIEGTTRHLKVLTCEAGHLHVDDAIFWTGPVDPLGFAEVWELRGELLARIPAPPKLGHNETLKMGPGRLK